MRGRQETRTSAERLDIQTVRRLIEIADRYGLEELSVSEGDVNITVRGSAAASAPAGAGLPARVVPALRQAAAAVPPAKEEAEEGVPLLAPMTGLFYRAGSPDDPPFVEEGDIVVQGQTVGLIEAMKVFSEVPAEIGGRVIRFLAGNGDLVQADTPLMIVSPEETVKEQG